MWKLMTRLRSTNCKFSLSFAVAPFLAIFSLFQFILKKKDKIQYMNFGVNIFQPEINRINVVMLVCCL